MSAGSDDLCDKFKSLLGDNFHSGQQIFDDLCSTIKGLKEQLRKLEKLRDDKQRFIHRSEAKAEEGRGPTEARRRLPAVFDK